MRRWRSLAGRGGGQRRQGWDSVDSLAEATDPFQVNCALPLFPNRLFLGTGGQVAAGGMDKPGVQRKPPPTPTRLLS